MRAGRWQRWWLGVAGLGGFLVLVEVAPRAGLVPERYLPPTSRITAALADELGQPSFWTALGDTLEGWAIGLAVAVAAGVGLGLLIGSVPALRAATVSTIEFLRPIPSVALIPLAVLLWGRRARASSGEASGGSSRARPRAARNPGGDGPRSRPSSHTTGTPASAASRANSPSRTVLPTPPGPWTCRRANGGSASARADPNRASSAARPTKRRRRAAASRSPSRDRCPVGEVGAAMTA